MLGTNRETNKYFLHSKKNPNLTLRSFTTEGVNILGKIFLSPLNPVDFSLLPSEFRFSLFYHCSVHRLFSFTTSVQSNLIDRHVQQWKTKLPPTLSAGPPKIGHCMWTKHVMNYPKCFKMWMHAFDLIMSCEIVSPCDIRRMSRCD